MIATTTLNENQLKAVKWEDGPLLVLAGPGSGKTRVLTLRIARMIEETPDKHFKVLGLTFTDKAATEMRKRIEELAPNARERTLLTTFHSFSADLLRQHGHHIGLKPDFTILSQEADRHSLLDEAISEANVGHPNQAGEKLLPLITRLTENDIAPNDALYFLKKNPFNEPATLASIYHNYRNLMIQRNSLDFSGLIAEALGLLKRQEGICKQFHRIYPHVCVDEFQDTNLSQYKILSYLVNPSTKNLFVVADDDQIIYQWNGASPERLFRLRDDFNMKLNQLPENYRCPPKVVAIANKLIACNSNRIAEKSSLKAHKTSDDSQIVTLKGFDDFSQEAQWVARDIAQLTPETGSKCVVLARTRKLLEQVVDALGESNVKGYLASRKNEFESAPLQWLHSVLRLANSQGSREYLGRVCKAFYSLEGIKVNVNDIISHSSVENGNYLRSWATVLLNRSELSSDAENLLRNSLLPHLVDRLDFLKFQKDAFQWLDDLPNTAPDTEGIFDEYKEENATWHQLVNEIMEKYGQGKTTLHLLMQELDLRSKSPEQPDGAIPCFTIHASKGLEFDHVYLMGMVEDQLPSWFAIKKGSDSREMQEERRNCFVAITRAQKTLTLTYSKLLDGWSKEPSRFLREMELLPEQEQADATESDE